MAKNSSSDGVALPTIAIMECMSERSIFQAALEIDDLSERDAFVARACGADVTLRREVAKLLSAHQEPGGFMQRPAPERVTGLDAREAAEGPGTVIGAYKLLEQIGEGGFGFVYMAEQSHPVRRRVALSYFTATAMARRGYDLSGDLVATVDDALEILVFQLGDLVSFSILVAAAVLFRRRADVHKRLMLLATVGALMGAPLAHVIGHWPLLRDVKAPIILVPLVMLYFASAVHDRLSRGRIHPVSLWVPLALFVWANLRAALIGPSDAWHEFAAWLIR